MKIMKKYILAALAPVLSFLFTLFCPLSTALARAEEPAYGTYAYVPNSNVYFYSDDEYGSRTGLFRLPYSYYVRIVSSEENYYKVEYLTDGSRTRKLTGYCKKDEILPVDYLPEMPYLYLNLDVTYTIAGGGKNDSSFSTITVTCAYYGDYTDGTKTYAYVLREDEFGYVAKPSGLSYPKNTEYDDRRREEVPVAAEKTKNEDKLNGAQITLLILLCLLVPTLAALLFRQPKKPPYDED